MRSNGRRLTAILPVLVLAAVVAGCNVTGPGGVTTASTTTPTTSTSGSTTTTESSTTVPSTTTTVPVTTTSTTQPSTGPSCGGTTTLTADGTTWVCTFDSEFTGSALDLSKWVPMETAADGYTSGQTACFVNTPNNISVGNGYLSLTARKEAAPFTCNDPRGDFTTQYTSGSVTSVGLFSQAYGRVEVMAKVPSTSIPGLQSSFWLYPQTGSSGELDIAETYSDQPGLAVPYFHYDPDILNENAATNANIVTKDTCTINTDQFNDYVIEWSPTTITVIYNGQTCLVDHWDVLLPLVPGAPFSTPLFVNLTQALGIDPNAFDPATTPLPATTEVQYVRAWQAQS
jgi:beta-glucanase (GH16 family)